MHHDYMNCTLIYAPGNVYLDTCTLIVYLSEMKIFLHDCLINAQSMLFCCNIYIDRKYIGRMNSPHHANKKMHINLNIIHGSRNHMKSFVLLFNKNTLNIQMK